MNDKSLSLDRQDIIEGRDSVDPSHPYYHTFPWLEKQVRDFKIVSTGNWIDIGPDEGKSLLPLLRESGFGGTVYAVDEQDRMLRKLHENFHRGGLAERIKLESVVMSASEISDGQLFQELVKSWPGEKRVPIAHCITAIELFHKAYSGPGLMVDSEEVANVQLDSALDGICAHLKKDAYFFMQDMHGATANTVVRYMYDGANGEIARHLVSWIVNPYYKIPAEFLNPITKDKDDAFWNLRRRFFLISQVTKNMDISLDSGYIPLNVLTEAAFRVVTMGCGNDADRCHKIYCALTNGQLIGDIRKKGMRLKAKYEVVDNTAREFFLNAGIRIRDIRIAPIYTAAVFQKE